MSKPPTPKPRPAGPKKFGTSTWIAAAFLLPALATAGYFGRNWNATRLILAREDSEHQERLNRNAVLSKVYDVLQNKKLQVCNKSQDTLKIQWVAAAYHDGKNLRVFDSGRCSAWQEGTLGSGDNRVLTLTSAQEGCNWNGAVVYFAMRFSRESEEVIRHYNYVAHYSGFDR